MRIRMLIVVNTTFIKGVFSFSSPSFPVEIPGVFIFGLDLVG